MGGGRLRYVGPTNLLNMLDTYASAAAPVNAMAPMSNLNVKPSPPGQYSNIGYAIPSLSDIHNTLPLREMLFISRSIVVMFARICRSHGLHII